MEIKAGKVVDLMVYRAARGQKATQGLLPFSAPRPASFTTARTAHRQRMLEHLTASAGRARPSRV
jgi:hypothetical protein